MSERDRKLADAILKTTNMTLDAAIELCEAIASRGLSAESCVMGLRDFKSQLRARSALTPPGGEGG